MDQRRAAGALLALVVCIATTAAAPTVSNQTGIDLYDSSVEGCYYNFQHYGEGDRIMTNEPCLNCTCHNRMLMCYLRVCPFTKPIGQDCTVEKRADQCCPIVTCPDVPVDLLTSTTTSPAEYGSSGVGKLDKYGCSINGKYFPEGSKVPPTPNKPCEHCYCIRNMTTCVMQECTLHVDGCTPIYHKDVCCPVRYSCDHPDDETLLLDDMTTTVRPTPGFLLTTTTLSPVTQMSQDCVHDDNIFPDGALIKTEKACEHCYCMKGDIVCVVQECGTPMENEGKNCTSQPPREGQCCPDTYICEGDEITTDMPSEYTTQSYGQDELTTRRVGIEGSGYRNEPDDTYTEIPSLEAESEGSGYEEPTESTIQAITPGKETQEETTEPIDDLHIGTTTLRTPTLEEIEKTTEPDKGLNTVPSDDDTLMHGYEPPATEKTETAMPEASDITKSPLETHDKEDEDKEKTSPKEETTEEAFTPTVISRLDEVASSTESVFRKDDGEITESYETVDKLTTQAVESDSSTPVHGLTTESETKTPFIEELEKITTISSDLPEKDYEHTFAPKEPTTESFLEETKPSLDITTETAEPSKVTTTAATVEKIDIPETTSLDENEIEDTLTTLPPGRIPGEGDCLLNEKTYRNNSEVPSYNACDTGCRCVSSIIKCDRIICSPPPAYMDNCQPHYDPPGSCCPTYVCHTGETMPPQPHSQMSGTESPVPSPPMDCHGDECEINKEKETPIDEASKKPEESECENGACHDEAKPVIQDQATEKCDDGKCLATPVDEPTIVPVKDSGLCNNEEDCKRIKPEPIPCEGEQCKDVHIACDGPECSSDPGKPPITPEQPLCENDEECKQIKPDVPSCEGDECSDTHKVCSGPDCDKDVAIPSSLPDQPLCENGEECKQTKPSDVPCEGDGCGSSPVECTGAQCAGDTIKPPVVSEKPACDNEEECKSTKPEVPSCEGDECTNVDFECHGQDCSTGVTKPTDESVHKPEEEAIEPCTGTSCRRKETDELESHTPITDEQSSGTESPLPEEKPFDLTTVKQQIQTDAPEVQSTISEEMGTKSPISEDVVTGAPKPTEIEPEHPYTESDISEASETTPKAPEAVIPDESITEVPAAESYTESEVSEITTPRTSVQTDQTTSPIESNEIEPEKEDERTEKPQDLTTNVPKEHDAFTNAPEQFTTNIQGDDKSPIEPTDEEFIQMLTVTNVESETERSPSEPERDVTKTSDGLETTETPEIGTKSPVSPQEQDMGIAPEHLTTISATEVPTATVSLVDESATEAAVDVPKTTLSDEKDSAQDIHIPTEAQEVTERISESATKTPDEAQTTVPETQQTDKHEMASKTPEKVTEPYDLTTEETVSPQHDTMRTEAPELDTEKETTGKVSDDEIKSQTTPSTAFDDHEVSSEPTIPVVSETDEEKVDEGSGMTQVTISEMETPEPSEKPITQDEDVKPILTSESPESNEIEEPLEVTVSPVTQKSELDESITESPEYSVTKEPSVDGEASPTEPSKHSIDTEEGVTEEPEISTEEPTFVKLPEDEKIPSEQFIPVHSETTPETSSIPTEGTTEKSHETPTDELVVRIDDTDKEPAIESTEPTDTVHTTLFAAEEPLVTEKQTTEYPKDHITEAELMTQSEGITPEPEKELEPTVEPVETKIKDEPTDAEKESSTDKPDKYSTVPEQTTEPHVTERDDLAEVTTIQSKDKEQTPQGTEAPESAKPEPQDSEVKPDEKPSEESLPEGTTEQSDVTKKTEEMFTEPEQETTESMQELPEQPQQEVTVDLEPTEKEQVPVTEKIHETATELLPKVTLTPQDLATELQEEKEVEVTSGTITERPLDSTTSAITPGHLPVEPQESTTAVTQDVTPAPEEKTTSAVAEDSEKHDSEGQEPQEVVTVTPSVGLDTTMVQDVSTEKQQTEEEEPIKSVTEEPTPVEQESASTDSSIIQEPTKPDLVELEEHTHKPIEEASTAYPVTETGEEIDKSTSSPSYLDESLAHSTEKPVERLGESSEEPSQTTQATPEHEQSVPEETPTTEKASDIERTTTLDDLISMTMKPLISSDHTKHEEPEAQTEIPSTESKPSDEGHEKPIESSEVPKTHEVTEGKPEETPTDKLDKETTEQPSQEPTSKPTDMPEVIETEKPIDEPVNKPSEEEVESQTDKPEEPSEAPLQPTEKTDEALPSEQTPLEVSTEKILEEQPVQEPVEEVTGQPEDTPLEEPSKETTEEPAKEKPSTEPTEKQQETTEKTEESSDKPSEEPSEDTTGEPEDKPFEKPAEEPSVEATEKPEEQPLEEPTEKPAEEPPVEATDKPKEQPLEEPTEKPAEGPSVEATEKPEEQPLEEPTEKPAEEPTSEAAEKPEEHLLGEPTEKPGEETPVEATEKTDEELLRQPTEKPADETVEEATKKPEDESLGEATETPDKELTEKTTGKPEEQPLAEPTEKPAEEPSAEATLKPEEKPLEEPIEKPAEPFEEPTRKPEEEPTAKPDTEPSEQTTEQHEEQPLGETTGKPSEIPSEEATESLLEVPTEKPAEEPSGVTPGQPEEEPIGESTDKPTEEGLTEKPQEQPFDEMTEKPAEEPLEKPSEQPDEKPSEESTEKQAEESSEKPEDKPIDQPTDKPTEEASEAPTEKPADETSEEQTRKPEGESSEEPISTPAQVLLEQPTEKPVEPPSQEASEKPLEEPSEKTPLIETTEASEKPHDEPVDQGTEKPIEQAATPEEEAEEKPMHPLEEKPPTEAVEKTTEKPEPVTEEKPQEVPSEPMPTAAPEVPKPGFNDVQPTDEVPDDEHFPTSGGTSGYGTEPDYDEDQTFGPGTCRYGGKVYVSAQQIPRDDPCDFCFCFRSDIICLQQSCPPPIHGCHEEPIQGFCCPRYECPVAMATTLNVTTTTTTTTTTLPPHFLPHAYKGAAQRRGCQIKGHTYKVGEVVRASSGPCLHCTCGGDGQMKCDPKACTPEPMLRQMIAAAVSAKRRR